MMVTKSNCPLSVERPSPPKVRSSMSNENKTRRFNMNRQLDAYKNATADLSQVYDGHDMIPQYTNKCRRNSGAVRLELDKKFSYSVDRNKIKPTGRGSLISNTKSSLKLHTPSNISSTLDDGDTDKILNMSSGFDSFNREEESTCNSSSAYSSLASELRSSTFRTRPKDSPTPITPKELPAQSQSDATSTRSKSRSPPRNMIRRKKSSPNHRNHEMNLHLSGIMKSPRYSHCKPEDLSRSLQSLDLKKTLADERLTKSMTDLDPLDWSGALDYNNVRFGKNVEVYVYKK